MKDIDGFEKVADYAWLKLGRKYWNAWVGNPFCVSHIRFPASLTKEDVIADIKIGQRKEKKRFKKNFPEIKW